MPTTRETIQSALEQNLVDEDGHPVHPRLSPGLTKDELEEFSRSAVVRLPEEIRDLLEFCSGIEGTLEQIDFSGRSLRDGFGLDFLLPHGIPPLMTDMGNGWVVDLRPGSPDWGPIYFCCDDATALLVQAATVQQFVSEVFKMLTPPHKSLIDDVYEDRLFDVWRKNPGVIPNAMAR